MFMCLKERHFHACACVITWNCRRWVFTSDLIQALSGNVIVLIDPFAVTFEVNLGGRRRPTPQLDRAVLHDEGVLRFQQKFREGLCWGRWEGIWEDLSLAVVAALWKHSRAQRRWRSRSAGGTAAVSAGADTTHLCVCVWMTGSHICHKANLLRGRLRCWQFAVWKGRRWHFHFLVLSGVQTLQASCSGVLERLPASLLGRAQSDLPHTHPVARTLLLGIFTVTIFSQRSWHEQFLPGRTLPFWHRSPGSDLCQPKCPRYNVNIK